MMTDQQTADGPFSPSRAISAIAGRVPPKAAAILLAAAAAALVTLALAALT
jgi:hypothetical protein